MTDRACRHGFTECEECDATEASLPPDVTTRFVACPSSFEARVCHVQIDDIPPERRAMVSVNNGDPSRVTMRGLIDGFVIVDMAVSPPTVEMVGCFGMRGWSLSIDGVEFLNGRLLLRWVNAAGGSVVGCTWIDDDGKFSALTAVSDNRRPLVGQTEWPPK